MKNNKFFSFSLMWEGIKQTKMAGICFLILSILASCGYSLLRLISYNNMSSETLKNQPDFVMSLGRFLLPIFAIQYIMPMVLIFMLFGFLNKRRGSDFYHSIPLNRTCIYITYSAVVLLWSLITVVICTFLSYTIQVCTPKIIISYDFILPTIISSFVLAMLVISTALIAKGLSGTLFSNIVIFIIIMFLPRIIICLYTATVNASIKIADISFMSITDIYNNIVFAPFIYFNSYYDNSQITNLPFTNAGTLWYSAILAIIYFVIALIIHKFRKSESAGKSAAYKAVQPVVRILLGAIPLLIISVTFVSGSYVPAEIWIMGIVVSLLAYFLYELITTKSAKKLITVAPFYLIAVLLNAVFAFACVGQRNSVLNDIPDVSDISSVSVISADYTQPIYPQDNYYLYKSQDIKLTDKELIKILQASLVDSVEKVKANKVLSGHNINDYEIIYHCASGRDIKRTVYVNNKKYSNNSDSVVPSYLEKDSEYLNAMTGLPADSEIKSVNISSVSIQFTDEEKKELWETYKSEYNASSIDAKNELSCREVLSGSVISDIEILGYIGTNSFSEHYYIIDTLTPKTYNKFINMYMSKCVESGIAEDILNRSKNDDSFSIDFNDMTNENTFTLQYYNSTNNDGDWLYNNNSIYGYFERYKTDYNNGNIDAKYLPEFHKIIEIIADSISADVDTEKDNLIKCDIYSYYSSENKIIYINITDKQYDEINNILKKCCKQSS